MKIKGFLFDSAGFKFVRGIPGPFVASKPSGHLPHSFSSFARAQTAKPSAENDFKSSAGLCLPAPVGPLT